MIPGVIRRLGSILLAGGLLAAGGLAGCGGTTRTAHVVRPASTLCIYVGNNPALIQGVQRALAADGSRGGAYGLRMCGVGPEAAVSQATTILYVGDAAPLGTAVAVAILDDAGIPQISPVMPSARSPATAELRPPLTFVPSQTARVDAAHLALRVPGCRMISPRPTRLLGACWLTAPRNMTSDGETAVDLLVAALRSLGRGGDSRAAVLAQLRSQRVSGTPLGVVAFDSQGQLVEYTFNLWRMGPLNRPRLVETVSAGPRLR